MLNEKYEQYEKNDFSLYYFLFYSFAYFAPVFVYSYDSNILLNIEEFPKIAHKICASTLATYPGLIWCVLAYQSLYFQKKKRIKMSKYSMLRGGVVFFQSNLRRNSLTISYDD